MGVRLVRIHDHRGPNRIKLLRIDPRRAVTLDVALSNNRLPGIETTSSMARRHGAIAAINADYTVLDKDPRGAGRPVNVFAEDGSLKTSSLIWGRNFAISVDESRAFVSHPQLVATMASVDSLERWQVTSWNERAPAYSELSASTPAGGSLFRPRRRACSVRLYPKDKIRWRKSLRGVEKKYVVDRVRCSFRRLPRRDGVVISARRGTRAARSMQRVLGAGSIVSLGWRIRGWPGVLDTVGGNPTLLENGRRTVHPCSQSYFCYRNPRTGIGVTPDGTLLLVTVDGRRSGSVGMTPVGFARLLRRLGATAALNLDGGGATTMVVKGNVVNQPSDATGQRSVGSAVLVLPRADPEEPRSISPRYSSLQGNISPDEPEASMTTRTSGLEAIDPASTGGMLDALSHGVFGRGSSITNPDLRSMLRSFRETHGQAPLHGQKLRLPSTLQR